MRESAANAVEQAGEPVEDIPVAELAEESGADAAAAVWQLR